MQSILRWNMLTYLALVLGILLVTMDNAWTQNSVVTIHNSAPHLEDTGMTNINGGPDVGDILNHHYFPALQDYHNGNYRQARVQMGYIIRNNRYLNINPRKKEYVSNACFIRGLIYFYHASGGKRLVLAKQEFENSIRWNPRHYLSYLELARLLSSVDLRAEAATVLQRLLALQPEEQIAQRARAELARLQSKKPERG